MVPKLQKLPLLQGLGLGMGTSGKQSARVIIMGHIFSYGFSRHRDHRLRYESNPRTTRAHFTGSIPPEVGALVALTDLNLAGTKVEGASVSNPNQLGPRTSPTQARDDPTLGH